MNLIRQLVARMLGMCKQSYIILKISLILSCVVLIGAFVLLLQSGCFSSSSYESYCLASELWRAPQAILLVAALGTVLIEERVVT